MGYAVFSCRRVVAWRSAGVYRHIRTLCRPDRGNENGIHGYHVCSCICSYALCQYYEQRRHMHGAYTTWICASSRYGKAGGACDSFRFLFSTISPCSSAIKFYRVQHWSPGAEGFQDRRNFGWNIGAVAGGYMDIIDWLNVPRSLRVCKGRYSSVPIYIRIRLLAAIIRLLLWFLFFLNGLAVPGRY